MDKQASEIHAVTGVFSYTGRYISDQLRRSGIEVRGLVRRHRIGENSNIDCRPLQFSDADALTRNIEGASVLYNTYWIRFRRAESTFEGAVANTAVLARASQRAGVRRIVHISVSNPSHASPFAYFRGKAAAEDAVLEAGLPCSIVRPTLVFGNEDILINNIAWLMRRFHAFVLPGDGRYRVQPVFVEDVARLAIAEAGNFGNRVLDAAGPEIYEFKLAIQILRDAIGAKAFIGHASLPATLAVSKMVSLMLRDPVITSEELGALMAETLISAEPPTAQTSFAEWVNNHAENLGGAYSSELRRHWSNSATQTEIRN